MENHELDFTSEPADGAYFPTAGRQGLLDQLVHLLQFGEGLPVVVGAAGAGKTAVLAQIESLLLHLEFAAYCSVSEGKSLSENLGLIIDCLGLSFESAMGSGEILASLRHFSAELAQEQKQAVLLVDDAQNLDDPSLGALVSLLQGHEEGGYGLRLLFAARPGLVERLDAMHLVDIPVYDFDVPLFSAHELAQFLHQQGLIADNSADTELLRKLWAKSMGNPGLALNLLTTMEDKLTERSSRSRSSAASNGNNKNSLQAFLAGMPIGHIAATAVLAVVLLWAVNSRDKTASESASGAVTVPRLQDESIKSPASSPQPDADTVERVGSAAPGERSSAPVNAPTPEVDTQAPAGLATPALDVVQKESAATVTASVTPVPTPTPTQVPTPPPTPEPTLEPTPTARVSDDEKYLLSRKDSEYSLQVLAASKAESLRSYIRRQPNQESLYLYQGYREGKRWYVVLAGVYPSREAALQARSGLPDEQRKAGPWPRALADIKQEINENSRF